MEKGFVLLCLFCFLACKSDMHSDRHETEVDWTIPTANEDAVLMKFSPFLVSSRNDTASLENNELINWVIDHNYDLERTPSGIFYHIVDKGGSEKPKWGDKVKVHYRGYLLDGTLFDSTYKRETTFSFYIGNVITGWNQALPLLGEGGKGVFIIPAHLAYENEGFGDLVGPGEHLRFDIELIEILENED